MCSQNEDSLNNVDFNTIDRMYKMRLTGCPPLSSTVVENVRNQLANDYQQLITIHPVQSFLAKLDSAFVHRIRSFLASPNYKGALQYLQEEQDPFLLQGTTYYQTPGALPPSLCSTYIFPSDIEFTSEGIHVKMFTSGFQKCQVRENFLTDIHVEGIERAIRIVAMIEEAYLDSTEQNYVLRKVTRTFHLPQAILSDQLVCQYFSDSSVLTIYAPWIT